jgi:hypothetical protein
VSDVSDELLMAYADGALDPVERARVDAYLRTAPEAAGRLAPFLATSREALQRAFAPILDRPLPDALFDAIFAAPMAPNPNAPRASSAPASPSSASFWSRLSNLFASPLAVGAFATACATAVIIGGVAGWSLHSGAPVAANGNALIALSGGGLSAGTDLAKALETSPSMTASTVVADGSTLSIMPTLTFKAQDGAACRQYEIGLASGQRFAGLGCRQATGTWRIEAHTPAAAAKSTPGEGLSRVAGGKGSPAVNAITEQVIDGAALSPEAEAALIKNGWR